VNPEIKIFRKCGVNKHCSDCPYEELPYLYWGEDTHKTCIDALVVEHEEMTEDLFTILKEIADTAGYFSEEVYAIYQKWLTVALRRAEDNK
jgi:hypothetical protein